MRSFSPFSSPSFRRTCTRTVSPARNAGRSFFSWLCSNLSRDWLIVVFPFGPALRQVGAYHLGANGNYIQNFAKRLGGTAGGGGWSPIIPFLGTDLGTKICEPLPPQNLRIREGRANPP